MGEDCESVTAQVDLSSESKGITSASSPNTWWSSVFVSQDAQDSKERLPEDTVALAVQRWGPLVAANDTNRGVQSSWAFFLKWTRLDSVSSLPSDA